MSNISFKEAYAGVSQDSLYAFLYREGKYYTVYGLDAPWTAQSIEIMPGSYNPIHDGHRAIFSKISNVNKMFEISLERVDKELLSPDILESRLKQFDSEGDVLVTRWPFFAQKTGVLSRWNITYHIGIDTAMRFMESDGIAGVQGINAKFIVYDRIVGGKRMGISNCSVFQNRLPHNFREGIAPDESLLGLNSSEIRANQKLPDYS